MSNRQQPQQPSKTRIEQWSDSAMLALISRVAIIIGTPAMVGLLGWVLLTTSENNAQIAALNATVSSNISFQKEAAMYIQRELDNFRTAVNDRFTSDEASLRAVQHDEDARRSH